MTKTFCDCCGSDKEVHQIELPDALVNGSNSLADVKVDVCVSCLKSMRNAIVKLFHRVVV